MPIVMKGNEIPIIRIDARNNNHKSDDGGK